MSNTNENPWADEADSRAQPHNPHNSLGGSNTPSQNPWELQQPREGWQSHQQPTYQTQSDPWSSTPQQSQTQSYAPPSGPPPGRTAAPRQNPVDETSRLVPESERGEQREALEQFELSRHRPQSTDDRNIETLTQEFPGLDGALIAAIYGDSKDMGASREMLGELKEQMKADG